MSHGWKRGRHSFGTPGVRYLGALAWVAVLMLLTLRFLASLGGADAGLTVSSGQSSVADVQVGSTAWLLGVEPGDSYATWPGGEDGLVLGPEHDLSLPNTMPSLPWWPVVVAVLSLFVALLVRGWAPGVASVLVVAASAFLAWELLGVVVMPLALGVVAVPTLVLGARWAAHAPGGGRRAAIAVATVIVIALEAVALATATRYTWRGTWAVSTWGPAILAAAVAGLAWAVSVRRAMATGASTTAAMVESTMAGRAALWSADERRREERAHWIHDAVLPRLSTGIRDIESGEPAAGSEALHHLAQDLREGLEDDQLTVLRVGGLSAALDDALEPARDAGFECQLSVDAEGDVPPWPVLVAAWRVAQEAIGNARRHSGGDRISVAVQMRHDHLMMEVSDDGVGLTDADLARRRGHLGMRSMTDAARAVQASLRFVAGSPSGLTVRFEWGR